MAGGQFAGGDGTVTSPYLIEDASDLNRMRKMPDKYYKLISNINLGVPPYNFEKGWSPIENFTGSFDGNGKKIYNLFINRPDEDNIGLFGTIKPVDYQSIARMSIHDIGLENVNIIGHENVGAIIGSYIVGDFRININSRSYNIVRNAYVHGSIKGLTNVGSHCGYVYWGAAYGTYSWNIAEDCMADTIIKTLTNGTNYGQIFGYVRDYFNTTHHYFNIINCIGKSTINSESGYGSNIGDMCYHVSTSYMNETTCRYNSELWTTNNLPTNANCAVTLTTEEMQDPSHFTHLTQVTQDNGWSLYNNTYPELWHQSPDYLFIKGDNGYYTFDTATTKWSVQSIVTPTKQLAIEKGMRHLQYIPQTAWDFFKTHSNPYIVNIMDKADTTSIYFTPFELTKDNINSNNDKTIYRSEVSFNSFAGTLATINI